MSAEVICVLYVCECGHLESDHDGPDGQCMMDNGSGTWWCACPSFTAARQPQEGQSS